MFHFVPFPSSTVDCCRWYSSAIGGSPAAPRLLRRCGGRWRVIVPDVADHEPLAVDPAPDLDVLAGLNGLAGGVDHRGGARGPGEIAPDADVADAVPGPGARRLGSRDVLRQAVFD